METTFLIKCPHCYHEQAPKAQRCENCGLNMMSDLDFRILGEKISPLTEQLQAEIKNLKEKGLNKQSWLEVQRLLKELAPYQKQEASLTDWLGKVNEELTPFWEEMDVIRKTIFVNLFILLILALVPVMAWLFGADQIVVILLCLPILGWGWFGFFGYLRKEGVI